MINLEEDILNSFECEDDATAQLRRLTIHPMYYLHLPDELLHLDLELSSTSEGYYYVNDDNEIIGFWVIQRANIDGRMHLKHLWVFPDYVGMNYGIMMLKEAVIRGMDCMSIHKADEHLLHYMMTEYCFEEIGGGQSYTLLGNTKKPVKPKRKPFRSKHYAL